MTPIERLLPQKGLPKGHAHKRPTQKGISAMISLLAHTPRVPVPFWSPLILAALVIAPLAALAVSSPEDAGAQQYAGSGVHISADANRDFPNKLIVFDSNAPPSHDPDLAVDIGNIAVLANNLDDEDADGLVDDPDENNYGGRAIFAFDQDVSIGSFLFVDKDHGSSDFAIAYNAGGEILARVPIPQADDGSVQQIDVNADGVRRFELDYRDSGGFTGIEVACQTQPASVVVPVAPTSTQAPVPAPAVAPSVVEPSSVAAAAVDRPAPAVLGAVALPAGGGPPTTGDSWFEWAAGLIVLTLALGGLIFFGRRQSR